MKPSRNNQSFETAAAASKGKVGTKAVKASDHIARVTGGQRAIAGFLFQILRSVQLGMRVTAALALDGSDGGPDMKLTLEPANSGDIRVASNGRVTIEQVKIRLSHLRWSSGEIARDVFPDLFRGVQLDHDQAFHFVTDNDAGLAALDAFLEHRHLLNRTAPLFHWGSERLSAAEFEARLAKQAGIDQSDERWSWLLDRLTLIVIDTTDIEAEIDALLAPMMSPGQRVDDKRHELISRLTKAASEGWTIDASSLLELVGRDALIRLQHAQSLPALLRKRAARDARLLGYDERAQARLTAITSRATVTILEGESGQGKTWSLCQAAIAQVTRGELAVVLSAPIDFAGLVTAINERVWLPAYEESLPLPVLARRLAPDLGLLNEVWLTIYIDDLQDRDFAETLARYDWEALGVRIAVSAQPRIATVLKHCRSDAEVLTVGDFTSAELRRYVRFHGGDDVLTTMPDDVFELLMKPVHARVFVELPARDTWDGVTEYELFKAYWDFSTGQARAQYDHPFDRNRLTTLVGSLRDAQACYPWRAHDLLRAGLDEPALRRLEQVGLLRRPSADRLFFSSDRMLNWAMAEHLVGRINNEAWSAASTAAALRDLGTITTRHGEPVGRRLGYVFHDVIWLLLQDAHPSFIADLLLAYFALEPHERRGEETWTQLATVGAALIPVLETLAGRDYGQERDGDIVRNLPSALTLAGKANPTALTAAIARLLASDHEQSVTIALKAARHTPVVAAVDRLWSIHLARAKAFDAHQSQEDRQNQFGELVSRYETSMAAFKAAVAGISSWLDRMLSEVTEPIALEQLVWCLIDQDLFEAKQGREIWRRREDQLLARMASDSKALIAALGHFGDRSHSNRLNNIALTRDDWMSSRVLKTRARIDPAAAFQQIRDRTEDYGWSAVDWWMPELARADPEQLSAAVFENASKGDHPLTDMILFYQDAPQLMKKEALEWLLETFTEELRAFNETNETAPDAQLGRLGHMFRFLPTLIEPWQFDCLQARAGSALEDEITRYARYRSGRTSRYRDTDGNQCERVLAMIGGAGYDQLVIAELARADPFGREDGYSAAHWTENAAVAAALSACEEGTDADGYRQVTRMQALAIHRCDAELEVMVRAKTPIFVNAAEMRSAPGRLTDCLRRRVEALLRSGRDEETQVAAELAGFLKDAEEASTLVDCFVDPATSNEVRQAMVGTFRALDLYQPALLPRLRELLFGREPSQETEFVATYLAETGDVAARALVTEWLETLDLGTWSSSRHAFLSPMLKHEDSRLSVVRFLERSRESGHVLIQGRDLRVLAEAGDAQAHDELVRSAYRSRMGFGSGPVAGIEYLRSFDADEAFFAASRYLAREQAPIAVDLLLEIDPDAAVPLLLRHYRDGKSSLRLSIARRLRIHLSATRLLEVLTELSQSDSLQDRLKAAELAGSMPPALELAWLDAFADDPVPGLREAARCSLVSRVREAAAMGHLAAMTASLKPLQWARLQTIFDCVDPHFLWSREDPASLEQFFDKVPPEFFVEARQLRERRSKALDDEAKKADRKSG